MPAPIITRVEVDIDTRFDTDEPKNEWQEVVFPSDCNEDGDCPFCGIDYGDCLCPGPTQDGYDYEEFDGVLYAKKNADYAD